MNRGTAATSILLMAGIVIFVFWLYAFGSTLFFPTRVVQASEVHKSLSNLDNTLERFEKDYDGDYTIASYPLSMDEGIWLLGFDQGDLAIPHPTAGDIDRPPDCNAYRRYACLCTWDNKKGANKILECISYTEFDYLRSGGEKLMIEGSGNDRVKNYRIEKRGDTLSFTET